MDISLSNVLSTVKSNLSVIAKRLRNSEGKSIFSDITISTAEDGVISQYITMAAENVSSVLKLFGTYYSGTSLTITSGRWSTFTQSSLTSAVQSYAAMFATGEYLAMVHPDLAKKYQLSAAEQLTTVINIAHEKKSTTASTSSYSDVSGEELELPGEYVEGGRGVMYLEGTVGGVTNPILRLTYVGSDEYILSVIVYFDSTVGEQYFYYYNDEYDFVKRDVAYSSSAESSILSAASTALQDNYGLEHITLGEFMVSSSNPSVKYKIVQ